jgi:hypothetical protein
MPLRFAEFRGTNVDILENPGHVEIIAVGSSIRNLRWLRENYGKGRWRKLKGLAKVRTESGRIRTAELHWYETHGIGRRGGTVKRYLD